MTEEEFELAILIPYEKEFTNNLNSEKKCARELDLRNVIKNVTKLDGEDLENHTEKWFRILVRRGPRQPDSKAVLVDCSDSTINTTTHKYHARAFSYRNTIPIRDRIIELQAKIREKETSVNMKQMVELLPKWVGQTQQAKSKLTEHAVCDYLEKFGYQAKRASTDFDHLKVDVIAENSDHVIYAQVKSGQVSSKKLEGIIKSISELPPTDSKSHIAAIVAEYFPNDAEIRRHALEQKYGLSVWHIHKYQIRELLPEYKHSLK